MCNSGLVFEPTERPAIFYNSSALKGDNIFHFYIKAKYNGACIGSYDFIEVADDRYRMVSGPGQIIFISRDELESKYHCIFDANICCKIYKVNL